MVITLWSLYTIGMFVLVVFVQLSGLLPAKVLLPLTSAIFFMFSLTHAIWHLGTRNAVLLFGITFVVSLLFESINLLSGGWIFGPLHYTHKLGIKVFDLVPVLIPLTWFTVGYLSLLIAERILSRSSSINSRIMITALLAAVIMTSWDLGMDPVMVANQHWVWEVKGGYFGIPFQNFLGWLVTSFCFFVIYLSASKRLRPTPWGPESRQMQVLPPLAYAVMWISMVIFNLDLGHVGAAVIGFFTMGAFAAIWLWDVYKE